VTFATAAPPRYSARVLTRERISLAVLLSALALTASLRSWIPLDEAVYRFIQFRRSCSLAGQIHWVDPAVRVIFGVIVGLTLLACRRLVPRLVGLAALVVGGVLAVELLKTAVERVRPNDSPGDLAGNSWPSGHIAATTMIAAAIVGLVNDTGWHPAKKAAVAIVVCAAVLAQAGYRLLNGSHWVTDVPLSVLLALAWMTGGAALVRVRRALQLGMAVVLLGVFIAFYSMPALRIRLPSALVDPRPRLLDVDFGQPLGRLDGQWSHGWREPIGPVSWIVGNRGTLDFRVEDPPSSPVVKVAIRPPGRHEEASGCTSFVLGVNGWTAPSIDLIEGWREVQIRVPDGVIRPGDNRLELRIVGRSVAAGRAPGRVAVRYVRLVGGGLGVRREASAASVSSVRQTGASMPLRSAKRTTAPVSASCSSDRPRSRS